MSASLTPPVMTEQPTLYVSGRFLHDRRGNRVVLRGVDYPLADDYNFPGSDYLGEIAQTGANAVRIQWYMTYGDAGRAPQLTPAVLGGFLDKCIAAKIVPIVVMSDDTSHGTSNAVNTDIVPWWTRADVKLLTTLQTDQIGWLAWSWYNDYCPARQMTETGLFSGLSPYGSDLVNNPTYGFKNPTDPVTPILP